MNLCILIHSTYLIICSSFFIILCTFINIWGAWSVRLEDLLNQAVSKGKVSQTMPTTCLEPCFYKGLRQDLKDISGHIFQTTLDFDTLRIAIRKLEIDHQPDLSVKAKLPLTNAAQDVTDE